MSHDHRDSVSIAIGVVLTVLSRLDLADWVQIIVAFCAIGNLGISFLRWRYPK